MLEWIAKIEMQERLGVWDVYNQFGDSVTLDWNELSFLVLSLISFISKTFAK